MTQTKEPVCPKCSRKVEPYVREELSLLWCYDCGQDYDAETGEIVSNGDTTDCPTCYKECVFYENGEELESCCPTCNITFDAITGEILIQGGNQSHTCVAGKDQDQDQGLWICVGCSFKTTSEEAAGKHTEDNSVIKYHTMTKKSWGTWKCDDCVFETHSSEQAKIHTATERLVNQPIVVTDKTIGPKEDPHFTEWNPTLQEWWCMYCKQTFGKNGEGSTAHDNHAGKILNAHYTKLIDNKWTCIYCDKTFDDGQKAFAHENQVGKDLNQSYSTGCTVKTCKHPPREIINEGTWGVWAGRRWDCEDHFDEFDVILNCTGTKMGKRHEIPIKKLRKWESAANKYDIINLDWPDQGVVDLPREFWRDLLAYLKSEKKKLLIFCVGGHGRTGTGVASMLILHRKYGAQESIDWVQNDENYCSEAIESQTQIKYIYIIAGEKYVPPPIETKTTAIVTSGYPTGQTSLL